MFAKIIFILFMLSASLYSAQFTEALAKKISDHIQPLLEKNLAEKTQRENLHLSIKLTTTITTMKFELSKRNERDTLFFLDISEIGNKLHVDGHVLYEEEKQIILHSLNFFFAKNLIDSHISVGSIGWGVVNKGVVNLYVNPISEVGGNLASQLVYGTSILLLEKKGSFFRVQGDHDKYLGWMKVSDFAMLTQRQWESWSSSIHVYNKEIIKIGKKAFPTGSCFALKRFELEKIWVSDFLNKEWQFTKKIFSPHMIAKENIIKTAKKFLPEAGLATKKYLWGGTTTSLTDCSGFVQLTYRMHNILLPRDSDQQFQFSRKVAQKEAKAGDLIFFSKHGKHPTHVGLYIDNQTFIHCSSSGPYSGVKINKLDGNSDYEKYLRKIYYGTGRIVK